MWIVCASYFLGLTWYVIIKVHSWEGESDDEKQFLYVYGL